MISHRYSRRSAIALGSGGLLATALQLRSAPAVQAKPELGKLGIALLGLGDYATNWLAPAIEQSKLARIAGVVTGSPEKVPDWQKKYGIPDDAVYNYENLEDIASNDDIDIIYVVTPTGLHHGYGIRALQAGKHLICEKPMAPTTADCTRMIEAARKAKRSLQIGYRLYWEPHHVHLRTAMRDKRHGDWKNLDTAFAYRMTDFEDPKNQWRIDKELGIGGALYDLGVYAVQAGFYASQQLPVSVKASSTTDRDKIFDEVPEHWEWELEYADGRKSTHWSSYGKGGNHLRMNTDEGALSIEQAYSYTGQSGETPDGPMDYKQVFQQTRQIDGQMMSIHRRNAILAPGEMGRRDIRLINAIMESADSGKEVKLGGWQH
ncbi:MAG: Gfo/Idh/MocA family oxidoreductase [Akkermansiaceae bacterium]|nr:Gfo/Idh/MocA family oxidoreductase [Akkermansiaceae bacterium]